MGIRQSSDSQLLRVTIFFKWTLAWYSRNDTASEVTESDYHTTLAALIWKQESQKILSLISQRSDRGWSSRHFWDDFRVLSDHQFVRWQFSYALECNSKEEFWSRQGASYRSWWKHIPIYREDVRMKNYSNPWDGEKKNYGGHAWPGIMCPKLAGVCACSPRHLSHNMIVIDKISVCKNKNSVKSS